MSISSAGFRRSRAVKFGQISARQALRVLSFVLPTISRSRMLREASERGDYILIEDAYDAIGDARSRRVGVGPFAVVVVPDVLVVGPAGLPVTMSGRIVKEPVSSPRGNVFLPALERTIRDIGLTRFLRLLWAPRRFLRSAEVQHVPSAVHVITRASPRSGGSQYAHWMLEHAPQIAAVRSVADRLPDRLHFLTNRHVTQFQRDVFDVFGVPEADVLPHTASVLHVERLIVATLRTAHSRKAEVDPRTVLRLREAFARVSDGGRQSRSDAGSPQVVSIMREDATRRRVANLPEVREVLAEFGVEPAAVDIPLRSELERLRHCRAIVGVHGAGLAKMLLCPELRDVVELVPPVDPCPDLFERLAWSLGVRYRRIVGELPSAAHSPGKNVDLIVPVDQLSDVLRAIVGPLDRSATSEPDRHRP